MALYLNDVVNARKPVFGYMAMVGSLFALLYLHSRYGRIICSYRIKSFPRSVFVLLTLLIAVLLHQSVN